MSQRIQTMLEPINLELIKIERVDYPYDPRDGQLLEPTFLLTYESQDDADVFNVTIGVVAERLKLLGLDTHQYFPGWTPQGETAQA